MEAEIRKILQHFFYRFHAIDAWEFDPARIPILKRPEFNK